MAVAARCGCQLASPHGQACRAVPPASSTPTCVQPLDGSTGIGASCSGLPTSMHSGHCWRQRWRWRRAAGASWPAPMAMPPGLPSHPMVPIHVCNTVAGRRARHRSILDRAAHQHAFLALLAAAVAVAARCWCQLASPHGHAPRAVPPASSTPTGVQLRDGSTGIGASCSELHSSMHSWHCWRQRWRWRRAAGASWPAPMAMPPGLSLRHRVPLHVCNTVTESQA